MGRRDERLLQQKFKSMACGFRNTEYFKTAIYFRCGGLDLPILNLEAPFN